MITFRFGPRRGTALLGIGLLLAGSTLGMYATYRLGWGNAATAAEAREVTSQVRQVWDLQQASEKPPGTPTPGRPIALLRIPDFGPTYEVAIAEGVDDEVLDHGLAGHVPGTALPGQNGNFAVAGNQLTGGGPFRHLDLLRPGDPIIVETPDTTYLYVVDDPRGTPPEQAMLTLATRASVWNGRQRMIVFAHLATASPKPARGEQGE